MRLKLRINQSMIRPDQFKRPRLFAVLPTLLTLGNAVCGFGSITFAAKVGPEVTEENALFIAALLVFFAMIFDALDGPVARWSKQASDFGAQLDSLCDAISFGVAPAFIMLKFSVFFHPRLLWVIAVLYMLCAILRLARFNVEKDHARPYPSFSGLPSPAAAGMIASVVIAMPSLISLTEPDMSDTSQVIGAWLISAMTFGLPFVTLMVACLMVSRIRYPHLFYQLFRGRRSFQYLVQLIFAMVAVFAFHELAIPLLFFYFVLAPPVRALWAGVIVRRLYEPSSSS
jgi:CDP-diacylglycerol--serine O-phosphatidyltransferase